MRARHFDVPVTGLTRDALQVRFDYQRGNHRIDIAKVSLLDAAGKILAEDVHPGFSGTATSNNTYSLTAPADVTAATLHVTLGGVANETDSWGATTVIGAKVAASSMVECALPRQCALDKDCEWTVACGSDLGELYLTPSLMTPEAWDILAAGLKWSRAHRDILHDTHWIGGHPLTEIYGYAAWHPQLGGTLVLRNPTARELTFTLDVQKAFELPPGAAQPYRLTRAMAAPSEVKHASPSQPLPLVLPPFAVQIWEAAAP